MKWVLIVPGVLVAVVLVCVLIGALRPREHVASSRLDLQKSRAEVWTVLADLAAWPQWNSAISETRREGDREGKAVWVMKSEWGEMPSVIEVLEPPSRLVTRIPEDAGLGFTGSWTYELLERPDGGSSLTLTERGEVGSPVFRFLMIFTGLHRTQLQFLRDLGKHMGTPEEPTPVDAAAG